MWIKVPLMPLIYTMLQEALLFNFQIMIHDLSILFNAQDSTAMTEPAHDGLSTNINKPLLPLHIKYSNIKYGYVSQDRNVLRNNDGHVLM